MRYPRDCEERRIGTKARIIAMNSFNVEHWELREQTGNDFGVDLIVELSEFDEWHNKKLECQIKGTKNITILKKGVISFPFDIKTINYALSSSIPFLLLLVDITQKTTYFLPIQRYFIENPNLITKLSNNTSINVHINPNNNVLNNDVYLTNLAQCIYKLKNNEIIPIEIL